MKIRLKLNEDGVTLLEVLIAMIILSLSLLMLLNMAMVALDGNDWSNNTTQATQLIQEKIEQLRGDPNLAPGSYEDTVNGMIRQWRITSLGNHLRQADVQIIWENLRDQTKLNSMSTQIRTDSV